MDSGSKPAIPEEQLAAQMEFFSDLGVTHVRIPSVLEKLRVPKSEPVEDDRSSESTGVPAEGPSSVESSPIETPGGERSPQKVARSAEPRDDIGSASEAGPPAEPKIVPESEAPSPIVFPAGPMTLEALRRTLGDCRRCNLCETRTQIVFGVGDTHADLMFVGEAPGADEDALGIPFVGRAGALLSRIILAIGLSRDQVYVANILKCRPPDNRDPLPGEVSQCEPFLLKQIEAVQPMAIVALGRYAAQSLLATETPISKLRGEFVDFRGVPLMPTFHPSYLLRNPSAKRDVWKDMQAVRDRLQQLGSRYYSTSDQ